MDVDEHTMANSFYFDSLSVIRVEIRPEDDGKTRTI